MTQEQFDRLIAILGDIGDFAYRAALRQVYVSGLTYIAWAVFFLSLAVAGLILLRWAIKGRDEHDVDAVFGCSLLGGGGLLAGSVFGFLALQEAIVRLASPQWEAIRLLAGLVK